MAMQTAAVSSKVLILVGAGAGLTSSIILKNERLSEVIAQLQELLKGVQDAETSPYRYDTAVLAAQIRELAQDIKEISMNNHVTIFNGNSESGSLASYVMPAAALGAMGYCYMLWKGLSLSDVMFVTKHNMQNAVASVSKQLDHLSDSLANTKKHLTKRLENLDWKMDEQMESSKQIASNVGEMNSNLSEIGFNVGTIHQMIAGLEGKLELLESKQDATNSGILYLCQVAQGMKDGFGRKVSKELGAKVANLVLTNGEEISLKGLQFLAEEDSMVRASKSIEKVKTADPDITSLPGEKLTITRPRFIHRTNPVGLSGFGTGA
ncbi:unnamed protein product [Linum trigynum]|uniref:DUF1664 domain-containing protein n=1 Tax=Linum trigynum TaxID=586398 RepID=A0AAV2CKH9_9ROSI